MTSNIADVLKLAAKPVQYDHDERTWLECRFKLENYLTLVDERYVALLQSAESQPVANLPTGTEESAVTIRTLNLPAGGHETAVAIQTQSRTMYALLATLTTGRSLRLVNECRTETGSRCGHSWWRKTHRRPRVGDSRCCKPCYSRG